MNTKEFYKNKTKLAMLLAGSMIFCILCIWVMVDPPVCKMGRCRLVERLYSNAPFFYYLLCVAGLILFLLISMLMIKILISNQPFLRLYHQKIEIIPAFGESVVIPIAAIKEMTQLKEGKNVFLVLTLSDSMLIENLTFIQQKVLKANIVPPTLSISTIAAQETSDVIEQAIRKQMLLFASMAEQKVVLDK
ncbi:STM3941 family protein [Suttonella ornithocola]|uniref:Uncharacterized protein n=1 Tax=Suttonella ornithocola TaxID=279832 RepID=A0A380N050_9GAMM|nr:STM3941 family protein [Suttonella ornithocola]SUO97646.1 Uncharacterised protein [Suttonella ornithocola]